MKTFTILDIISSRNAILHSKGMKVYEEVASSTAPCEDIVLDFNGICSLTTAFLHPAIGKLVTRNNGREQHIHIKNMDQEDIDTLVAEVIERAKSPEKRRIASEQVASLFED
ncbi:STAS-like domain-containing protein [Roseivirga sp. BDSF3-8]|uniref:STAS-like domain-containing protein n=1 Tax=Roseivirga sp. BDSF3-8 TaxID=3241598 RepID=UPI0035320A33